MTNEQIDEELWKLTEINSDLDLKIKSMKTVEGPVITEDDLKKIEKDYERYLVEWKKRKSGCLEMVDMISEGMDMNWKEFMKMLGMETDEDFGVVMPAIKR